jgi:hypothetical protein
VTSRPAASAYRTEDTFAPQQARFVRLTMLAHSSNAKSAVDTRLDEFEAWTPGPEPRNVALVASGAKASGITGNSRDFAEAYGGTGHDGKCMVVCRQPAVLTIAMQPEAIDWPCFLTIAAMQISWTGPRRRIRGLSPPTASTDQGGRSFDRQP